jgi:hypothetical protein
MVRIDLVRWSAVTLDNENITHFKEDLNSLIKKKMTNHFPLLLVNRRGHLTGHGDIALDATELKVCNQEHLNSSKAPMLPVSPTSYRLEFEQGDWYQ